MEGLNTSVFLWPMKIRLNEKMDGFVGMILKFCFCFLVEESVDTTGLVIRTYDRKALCTCRIYERFCGGFNFTSSHNKPAFDSLNGIEDILRKTNPNHWPSKCKTHAAFLVFKLVG